MKIFTDRHEFQHALDDARRGGARVGFVPTMGALHAGHGSLLRRARTDCDVVAASIFVNPLQFGQNEDLSRYPTDAAGDRSLCEDEGVDLILWPNDPAQMYGEGPPLSITVGALGDRLCGATRPGHFAGVATVVAKLFNLAGPCRAYFGEKDAQQLVVIRRLVSMFDFPIEVIGCPTEREADGLAMSSRNVYLSSDERIAARALSRGLFEAKEAVEGGERDASRLAGLVAAQVHSEALARLEYVACVDPENLEDRETLSGPTLIALAAFVGSARLIDNLTVTP